MTRSKLRSSSPDFTQRLPERFLVSACLAGVPCRYDGRSNSNSSIISLVNHGRAVLVCPELLGGLSVHRLPCEIRIGRVYDIHGFDKTSHFERGALMALNIALAHGCSAAILKARSPSCGYGSIYDGSFHHILIPGNGFFASLLEKAGLTIFSEENIGDLPDML